MIEVAGATGLDEVTGAGLAKGTRPEVGDLITPVDVVLEHVRRTDGLGVHRTQAVARVDQVVDRHAGCQ
ncbi:hypothetical protein D9M73_181330 [compost metagenome]